MEVGDSASDFELEANDGTKISLKSFAGKNNVVLCFYPKKSSFCMSFKKGVRDGGECDFCVS